MKKQIVHGVRAGLLSILLPLLVLLPSGTFAQDKPTAELTMSFMSQYIWRGYELSRDSLIIQPSVTIGYKGLSANIWQNIDTDYWDTSGDSSLDSLNETDITMSYAKDFGAVAMDVGYIWYSLDAADDSQEVYGSLTFNAFLSPTITIYREFSHYPSTYITLGVSHSIELSRNMTLDLQLQGSYLISDDVDAYPDPHDPDDEYNDFHDGLASISLNIPINQYVTLTPELYWSFPLSSKAADDMQNGNAGHDGKDNFFYGGVSVSLLF